MGGGIHHVVRAAMEVQYRHVAAHFSHELLVMLGFREVKARAIGIDIGAVSRPFCLNRGHRW